MVSITTGLDNDIDFLKFRLPASNPDSCPVVVRGNVNVRDY